MRKSYLASLVIASFLRAETLDFDRSGTPTSAILDSFAVREAIIGEEAEIKKFYDSWGAMTRDERAAITRDAYRNPDKYLPGRNHFFQAMANAPSITVPGHTRGKVLEISKARCSVSFGATITYIKVRIETKNQAFNPYSLPFERP
jgi:hypothetical protein